MKYVVLVPDGCAAAPLDELGGRTPLEAAAMPRLATLAARGEVGRAAVIPDGLPPGSDVGNMAILGYDPARFHTGRAPIEAAAMGVELLTEEETYALQKLGDFDNRSSSWVKTPDDFRDRGGALCCDRRFGRVFTYCNGAESYYAARGWRGSLRV